MGIPRSAASAVLLMRVTLGVFLMLWSIEKLIVPSAAVRIAASFYGIAMTEGVAPLIGLAELTLSLALIIGVARRPVYGIATIFHTVSTIASWRQLLDPFGLAKVGNHLFIAGIPVLGPWLLRW
jgi:putative oxidoreductase